MPYFSIKYRDRYEAHQDRWFPGSYGAVEAEDLAAAAAIAAAARPGIEVYSVTRVFWDKDTFEATCNQRSEPRELKNPPRDSKGAVILWEDNNGLVTCLDHAGAALTAAIEARPSARRHDTSIATYWKVASGRGTCQRCAADRRFNDDLAKNAS